MDLSSYVQPAVLLDLMTRQYMYGLWTALRKRQVFTLRARHVGVRTSIQDQSMLVIAETLEHRFRGCPTPKVLRERGTI